MKNDLIKWKIIFYETARPRKEKYLFFPFKKKNGKIEIKLDSELVPPPFPEPGLKSSSIVVNPKIIIKLNKINFCNILTNLLLE